MKKAIISATVLIACVSLARAGIRADLSGDYVVDFATTMDMPFMSVGNLGNLDGPYDGGFGAVDYAYDMGKFEVTAGQYTEFLNAVAADDTYALYRERMSDPVFDPEHPDDLPHGGCNIQRAGGAGSYTYSVAADWADRPVNYVSWGDVTRFANWLTNGMPTGAQDLTTTEDGAYFLDGATSSTDLKAAVAARKSPGAGERFFYMPSEDEWYKPAFHKNDGDTGNYFDYATSSDVVPGYIADGGAVTDPDPGNMATYDGDGGVDGIGAPYYRTEVGEHENTPSPYGTFDMNGNVGEWTEGLGFGSFARVRNGDYVYGAEGLHADYRRIRSLTRESGEIGFRISTILGAGVLPGDYDEDGDVDADDVNLCCDNIGTSDPEIIDLMDLDGDFDVDEDDCRLLIETLLEYDIDGDGEPDGAGTFIADFNTDGAVDLADLTILRTNSGQTDMGFADGDTNCDGTIDLADLTNLRTLAGSVVTGGVPEPTAIALMAIGGIGLLRRRPKA